MPALVIQTSFLGDTVLTTPLLAELAARGPVDVVVTPASAAILQGHPSVRELIVYDKRGANAGMGGVLRLARRLRAARYDAAYLAQGSLRSAVLALAARIPRRIGFSTSAGRALYTERVRYRPDAHHAERLWRLAAGNDVPSPAADVLRPRLFPGAAERAAVDALLGEFAGDGPLIGLAPGSIWGTKRWPHFAELAARLEDARLVVIGSAGDGALAARIAEAAPARVLDATGRLSLLASAELIARCAALVANDSAPTHLASGVGTPTLTLFGPTVPAFGFGPLAPRSEAVGVEHLACRPCHAHGPMTCPLRHFRCMQDLESSRVLALLRKLTAPTTTP